jgi:cytoskeletal protein CcmA (bactofilin family)
MVKSKADKNVTLIAGNTSVEGHVRFSGELYVNGTVVGDIVGPEEAQGALVVSEEGSVKGEIRAPNVIVSGSVEGDVHADVRVELGKSARVRGDIYYKLVEVHVGAVIDGRMVPQVETAGNVHALPVGARDDDGPIG